MDYTRTFVASVAVTDDQRHSLLTGLAVLQQSINPVQMPACVYLPILAYGAVRADGNRAIPLAGATTLLNAGRHLLDDVVDGHIQPTGTYSHRGDALLLGVGFLSVLPLLALLELDTSLQCRVRLQRTLLGGLIRIHVGQQSDLALTESEAPSPAEVEDSARGKTGETYAMYAALGAELAEAPPQRVSQLAAMGVALGTAFQLGSDCADVFADESSADLDAGTRTLPLALHLHRLTGSDRASFLTLLNEARENLDAQKEVRTQLRRNGAVRACGIVIEAYRRRAHRALDAADPLEPARSGLRELIDSAAMLPSRA